MHIYIYSYKTIAFNFAWKTSTGIYIYTIIYIYIYMSAEDLQCFEVFAGSGNMARAFSAKLGKETIRWDIGEAICT